MEELVKRKISLHFINSSTCCSDPRRRIVLSMTGNSSAFKVAGVKNGRSSKNLTTSTTWGPVCPQPSPSSNSHLMALEQM